MNIKAIVSLRFGLMGTLLTAVLASAQPVGIAWFTIDTGGGTSSGSPGGVTVSATVGQPDAGQIMGGSYAVSGGFWDFETTLATDPRELIINGSFEDPRERYVADSFGLMSLPVGSDIIPGWRIASAELAWVRNGNTFEASTPFGTHSLELTGYHDEIPFGGVTQTIPTVPGAQYRLSLCLGSNADYPGAGGQKQVQVTCGLASTNLTLNPFANAGNEWSTLSFDFAANAASTVVTITGVSANGIYLGLDNVSVLPREPQKGDLRIVAVQAIKGGLLLSFTTEAGQQYIIESQADLRFNGWEAVPDSTLSSSGETMQITIPRQAGESRRFYRVKLSSVVP